ncbi:hypothetical protein [Variovorax sp. LjRoot178]|uniref:hypothetical protein n=1 Tax=Variovorax sp. LjRoot178 TaxID=3342277 RepID=UPI003ECD67C0
MPDDNAKFDKEALSLIESLKGRRKPVKRAPRKAEDRREEAADKEKVVVRRAANRFPVLSSPAERSTRSGLTTQLPKEVETPLWRTATAARPAPCR